LLISLNIEINLITIKIIVQSDKKKEKKTPLLKTQEMKRSFLWIKQRKY